MTILDKYANDYDVLVIGGGPGGYVSAIHAAKLRAKTALIERDALGGTCLNRGCIPTKALLAAAQQFSAVKNNADTFGLDASAAVPNMRWMMQHKDDIINRLTGGIDCLMKKNKVNVIYGQASFVGSHSVLVNDREITADKIIIATGSVVRELTLPGDMSNCVTSDEILFSTELPKQLAVIGGGVVGVELASIFADLGVKVTILEVMPDILQPFDREQVGILKKVLIRRGMTVLTNVHIRGIIREKETSCISYQADGVCGAVEADKILVAAGRIPYFGRLELEKAGVKSDGHRIPHDPRTMQTNVPHIYAIGDVTGGIQLAHVASAQGLTAAAHAMGEKAGVNLNVIPSCIYTSPEIAAAGMTEQELKDKQISYQVAKFMMSGNGKSLTIGETDGLVKLLYDPESGEIFGIHLLCAHATEMIAEAVLALSCELTITDLANTIHSHPTLSEAIMEVAHIAAGQPVHQ